MMEKRLQLNSVYGKFKAVDSKPYLDERKYALDLIDEAVAKRNLEIVIENPIYIDSDMRLRRRVGK